MSDFSGQVVARERKAPDEITERVAALRQGSEANGRPWLEQELHGLAVSVLRSVATTLGVAVKEGGRNLVKEDLVSKITTKFLPEVGDVLMSLWFCFWSKIFLCCRFYSKNLFLLKWFLIIVDCSFTGDVFRVAKQSSAWAKDSIRKIFFCWNGFLLSLIAGSLEMCFGSRNKVLFER